MTTHPHINVISNCCLNNKKREITVLLWYHECALLVQFVTKNRIYTTTSIGENDKNICKIINLNLFQCIFALLNYVLYLNQFMASLKYHIIFIIFSSMYFISKNIHKLHWKIFRKFSSMKNIEIYFHPPVKLQWKIN